MVIKVGDKVVISGRVVKLFPNLSDVYHKCAEVVLELDVVPSLLKVSQLSLQEKNMEESDLKVWWLLGWDNYYPGVDNWIGSFHSENAALKAGLKLTDYQHYKVINIFDRLIG